MKLSLVKSVVTTLLATAVMLSLSGCGTMVARGRTPPEGHYPYMGVVWNVHSFTSGDPFGTMLLLDLPFSAVVDTVLLPLDLIHVVKNEEWSRYTRTRQMLAPMTDMDTLVVESDFDSIFIRGDDTDECRIEAEIRATTTPKRFPQLADKVEISITPLGKTLSVGIDKPRWEGQTDLRLSLDITVPRQTNLLCTGFRHITVEGIHAGIELRNPRISQIILANTAGPIDLRNSFGRIDCRNITSHDVNIRSEWGDIAVTFSRATPPDLSATVTNTHGDIRMEAPFEFAGEVDFEASGGSIYNALPVLGHADATRVTGTVGEGDGKLRLKIEDGTIRVFPFNPSRRDLPTQIQRRSGR